MLLNVWSRLFVVSRCGDLLLAGVSAQMMIVVLGRSIRASLAHCGSQTRKSNRSRAPTPGAPTVDRTNASWLLRSADLACARRQGGLTRHTSSVVARTDAGPRRRRSAPHREATWRARRGLRHVGVDKSGARGEDAEPIRPPRCIAPAPAA